MEEDVIILDETNTPVAVGMNLEEYSTFYESFWNDRLTSYDNFMLMQLIGSALIAGCLIATMILQFFVRR